MDETKDPIELKDNKEEASEKLTDSTEAHNNPHITTLLPPPAYRKAPEDRFSKGRVVKYFPQSHYGFIKDRRGKDLYFNIDELRFSGEKGREYLKEGIEVGYDVAWTSKGLHISKIKIY